MLPLTKSDFLEFRHCAKAFWRKKNRPGEVQTSPPSAFDRMLAVDGYAVESETRRLVETWPDCDRCHFQVEFIANGELLARADLIKEHPDGSLELYEIKSSTGLKSASGDHIVDACFQLIALERAGVRVRAVHVIHVNGDYVRDGEIDPKALLSIVNVTTHVNAIRPLVESQIGEALELVALPEIDENGCSCRHAGSADSHCASYAHFNPDVPELSAHLLPRISTNRLKRLDEEGRFAIEALTAKDVTAAQLPVLAALQSAEVVTDPEAIAAFLAGLSWPLHFYDYETFASAIPIGDGYKPHGQVPVQFSLHRLHADGTLNHFEFLADRPGQHHELAAALAASVEAEGSALAWYASFEKGQNGVLAGLVPTLAPFFEDLNQRTIDLMDPFKADYVHPGFKGSASIKKVLPIVCPELSYEGMPVHDGAGAMEAWRTMIETVAPVERARLRTDLLAYCKLDTLAMVRIFEFLRQL